MTFELDVVVIGGCGRAGLPLGAALAASGLSVGLFDTDSVVVGALSRAETPFREAGLNEVLQRQVASGALIASDDPAIVSIARALVVTIGTTVDEHLNPDPVGFLASLAALSDRFVDDQLLVLRSTVFPGVTRLVEEMIAEAGLRVEVAFCPERIAEGQALEELRELPELIGARTESARTRADALFRNLTDRTEHLTPEEAELAKLFCNSWRYLKFAIGNQLFMMANDYGVDYDKIREAIAAGYPRAADLPSAGFAAGPCLFKDTMQLAAFNNNSFTLGHAGMLVNEGLPLYVVSKIAGRFDLSTMTVGILGMAFKAESDDIRSSLSYKLKKILQFRAAAVLCQDPFVTTDPELRDLDEVLARSDLLIIGAPHRAYSDLVADVPVVDIWNVRGDGVLV